MERIRVKPLQPIDFKVSKNFEAYLKSGFITFITEEIKKIEEVDRWEVGDRVYWLEPFRNGLLAASPSGLFFLSKNKVSKVREGVYYCVKVFEDMILVGGEEGGLILNENLGVEKVIETPGTVFSCDVYGERIAIGTCCEDAVFVLSPYHLWTFRLVDGAWGVSWSPDGENLAVGSDDGNLYIFSRVGKLITKKALALRVRRVDWKREIAAGCYDPGYVFSFNFSSTLNLVWKKRFYNVWGLSWDPSRSLLAAGDADTKSFYIIRNGEVITKVDVGEGIRSLTWKEDKIFVGGERSVMTFKVVKGDEIIVSVSLLNGGRARIRDKGREYLVET